MINLTTINRIKSTPTIAGMEDITGSKYDTLLGYLITSVSQQIEDYLGRWTEKVARTEYFDCEYGQDYLWLKGYPIAAAPAIQISNDNAMPPTYTTALVNGTDYVLYPEESGMGKVQFVTYRSGGPRALRVIYTGGMAGGTSSAVSDSGVDGVCSDPGGGANNQFDSATASFVSDGTRAGDVLTITGGGNAGNYTVSVVVSETRLLMVPAVPFPVVPAAAQTWSMSSAVWGLMSLYPAVAAGAALQVGYLFRHREKFGLTNLSAAGGSVAYQTMTYFYIHTYAATGLVPEVQQLIEPYRRKVYGGY